MPEIYVDADGCPVKDEVYRVAGRYGLKVWVVTNGWLRVPEGPLVARVTVSEGLDRRRRPDRPADRSGRRRDHRRRPARCVERGARAIAPDGRAFTPESIGSTLATRT